ncbi:hypothetical protein GW17_00055103 [Ensete ventricosum]|nr:hypothetical protein GW17_00055103 [Ensete ventricosum]
MVEESTSIGFTRLCKLIYVGMVNLRPQRTKGRLVLLATATETTPISAYRTVTRSRRLRRCHGLRSRAARPPWRSTAARTTYVQFVNRRRV